jgi:hypothetical protein
MSDETTPPHHHHSIRERIDAAEAAADESEYGALEALAAPATTTGQPAGRARPYHVEP